MLVYSKRIVQFITEINQVIREILSKEVRLRVSREHFFNQSETTSYPIKVVIFNHKKLLGYFDPFFYELGFHESLMHTNKAQLHNVIRHELAHYITFINEGENIDPHGVEFRSFCQKMGWTEEVYRASSCLEGPDPLSNQEQSPIFRKVQKLMALSTSSNKNEAESAMIKSQQLLLKHNLDSPVEDEEKLYLKRLLQQKTIHSKMRAIGTILETFFVSIVYRRTEGFVCVEVVGNHVNVEIADYVATFLDTELDHLWNQARKGTSLKGTLAKNSFFLGLAKGYCNKIHSLKRDYSHEVTQALMVLENQLLDAKSLVYPRLSSTRHRGHYCPTSSALGEKMGRDLTINPAVGHSSRNAGAFIDYLKK